MNINEKVEFRLTEHGKAILLETVLLTTHDKMPVYDDGNLYRLQLWKVMQVFGPYQFNGGEQVFVDNEINPISGNR